MVLDLMLPDMDGLEICRQIRTTSDVPILMLTARDDDVDKIVGLEVGADDYLTKPFNPRELVARIKTILRRSATTARRPQEAAMEHGNVRIDAGRREVTVRGEQVQLAPKEFDLLWELLDHRGLVLTRDQLLERVWGYTFAGDTRTVDVHVRQLGVSSATIVRLPPSGASDTKSLTMLRSLEGPTRIPVRRHAAPRDSDRRGVVVSLYQSYSRDQTVKTLTMQVDGVADYYDHGVATRCTTSRSR